MPGAFDPDWYRQYYPDAALARGGAALHWLRHGRVEGRRPCAIAAAGAEAALWTGDAEARGVLAGFAAGDVRTERIYAHVALARAAAAAGDWQGAANRLAVLDPLADLALHLGMPGPLLFHAEVSARCEDPDGARRLLSLVARVFGASPSLALARAGLALAVPPAGVRGWEQALTPVFAPVGLGVPLPQFTGATAFDRLSAPPSMVAGDGPLVSVIVPVRDGGAMLDTALASLSAQSWRALEILVIDNGSRDDSAARADAWAARDSRFRRIDAATEPGAYAARNLGAAEARGDMITLQDADDWSHPDRILRQVQAMLAAPGQPACLSFWCRMTDDLQPSCVRPDIGLLHPNLSSLMLRREVLAQAGYWDRVRAAADTEYVARLQRHYGPGAVAHVLPGVPLAFGRLRAGSLTGALATGLGTGPGAAARSAYLAAARVWHETEARPFLPLRPTARAFPAPAALDPLARTEGAV